MKLPKYKLKVRTVTLNIVRECSEEALLIEDASKAFMALRAVFEKERLDEDREHYVALALNARSYLIGYKVVSSGTATAALVHPREVFKPMIGMGAISCITAHNHPSGNPNPSPEDIVLTDRLRESGELLGIPLIDSLVITSTKFRSIGGEAHRS